MSGLGTLQTFASTSAAGAMRGRQVRQPVLVGCLLAGLGTSAASAQQPDVGLPWQPQREQTTAGGAVPDAEPAGAAIGELRRLSGLTWEQLARLFDVSRRSLHFWASGKPMTASNEERLQRLLAFVRKIDRGSATANRAMLLGVCEDGSLPIDLLAAGEYDRALSWLALGDARRSAPPKLSDEARAARTPRPPEHIVGALHDRIHPKSGRLRDAKAITGLRGK